MSHGTLSKKLKTYIWAPGTVRIRSWACLIILTRFVMLWDQLFCCQSLLFRQSVVIIYRHHWLVCRIRGLLILWEGDFHTKSTAVVAKTNKKVALKTFLGTWTSNSPSNTELWLFLDWRLLGLIFDGAGGRWRVTVRRRSRVLATAWAAGRRRQCGLFIFAFVRWHFFHFYKKKEGRAVLNFAHNDEEWKPKQNAKKKFICCCASQKVGGQIFLFCRAPKGRKGRLMSWTHPKEPHELCGSRKKW